ncbi:MAG: 16S rRNA (cytidine(1402)-2'-O)-methyltransferase [Thermoleophilia bacterium]|nr:16S rRNA (cytidine(1402)-2'-O)-methyltransferase [Thermoleophilia bacterium]
MAPAREHGDDGLLYICPTPIGNLGDITLRVLEVLKKSDLVAAEDTRRTLKLLSHYGISKPLTSYYEHNELRRVPELLGHLREGKTVALVSDAGMPGISDPGYRLIKSALDEGLPVEVLPGPSSIETALVSSGFPTDSFLFTGYLPRRRGDLRKALAGINREHRTTVAFEAPHRLRHALEETAALMGERQIAICRELTKKFQEIKRGSAAALLAGLPEKVRGEIVMVFEGKPAPEAREDEAKEKEVKTALTLLLDAGLSPRRASEIVSLLTGAPKNKAYRLALAMNQDYSS